MQSSQSSLEPNINSPQNLRSKARRIDWQHQDAISTVLAELFKEHGTPHVTPRCEKTISVCQTVITTVVTAWHQAGGLQEDVTYHTGWLWVKQSGGNVMQTSARRRPARPSGVLRRRLPRPSGERPMRSACGGKGPPRPHMHIRSCKHWSSPCRLHFFSSCCQECARMSLEAAMQSRSVCDGKGPPRLHTFAAASLEQSLQIDFLLPTICQNISEGALQRRGQTGRQAWELPVMPPLLLTGTQQSSCQFSPAASTVACVSRD